MMGLDNPLETMQDITKSAGSQTNNKSSDNDSMIAEFYKNVYQKTYHQTLDWGS